MPKKHKRKRLFLDRRVQGILLRQALFQWTTYAVGSFLLLLLWQVFKGGLHGSFGEYLAGAWAKYTPMFAGLLLLFPVVIWDCIKTSHRFVGPVYRFQNALRGLARGERVPQVVLRPNDLWNEVADDLNAVLERFQTDESSSPETQATSSPDPGTATQAVVVQNASTCP